jgi:rubrerythrin
MSPEALLTLYVLGLLGILGFITLRSELLRRRVEREVSEDRIFRCDQCGLVYTDDANVDRSRCPQCGRTNGPFVF